MALGQNATVCVHVLSQVHALCTHTCKSPDVHPLELLFTNLSVTWVRGKGEEQSV